jgi:hypothetical protein
VIAPRNIPSVWGAGRGVDTAAVDDSVVTGSAHHGTGDPVPRRHKPRVDRLTLRVWVNENACETRRTVGWRGRCSCGWRGRLHLNRRDAAAEKRAHAAGDHESAGY